MSLFCGVVFAVFLLYIHIVAFKVGIDERSPYSKISSLKSREHFSEGTRLLSWLTEPFDFSSCLVLFCLFFFPRCDARWLDS